jgi:hypothetical protein
VQEIMGDIFSLGFGPYRWVCTSGENSDLVKTDAIAAEVMLRLGNEADEAVIKGHFEDNLKWVQEADKNQLVVGSQARILYANCEARVQIALKMNQAIADGTITAPVVLSRDHHDVSGKMFTPRDTYALRTPHRLELFQLTITVVPPYTSASRTPHPPSHRPSHRPPRFLRQAPTRLTERRPTFTMAPC